MNSKLWEKTRQLKHAGILRLVTPWTKAVRATPSFKPVIQKKPADANGHHALARMFTNLPRMKGEGKLAPTLISLLKRNLFSTECR